MYLKGQHILWKITFLNKKNLSDKNDSVLQLCKFMSSLTKDSWILISASTSNLLWYVALIIQKRIAPHKYVMRKKEVYVNVNSLFR